MCRWQAYSGRPIPLEGVLFDAQHSLIEQSKAAQSSRTPTNADGVGLGWYGIRPFPGLFRSIRPAWNDFNLRDLAAQVESGLFLAHVRATSRATVQETNCHPFRYEKWLFVHNGEVRGIDEIRRELMIRIAPKLFPHILGTTDSEVLFYLALTFGLEKEPLGALERMAGFVEHLGRANGIAEPLTMTLGVSDGKAVYAVRYASDCNAPTLHYSKTLDELIELGLEAALAQQFGPEARMVVSEPIGELVGAWVTVPQSSGLRLHHGALEVVPFRPTLAGVR